MKRVLFAFVTAAVLPFSVSAESDHSATHRKGDESRGRYEADNTGKNVRDRDERDENAKTADDAGGSSSDRELAAAIRREVVKDDSLSMSAHNSKIIVEDGRVTLRGPVKSNDERRKVEAIAKKHAKGQVMNQLEVDGDDQKEENNEE